MQFTGKLKKQTSENGKKKKNFEPNFGLNLGHQICFCGFNLHQMRDIVLRKTNEPENGQKPHIEHDLGLLGPNSGCLFFFKDLAQSVTRYHGQLSSCTIPEKTNDPILRKVAMEGWTDEAISQDAVQLTMSIQNVLLLYKKLHKTKNTAAVSLC